MQAACVVFFKNIWTEKKIVLFSVVLTVEVSVKNILMIKEEGAFYESGYRSINHCLEWSL